MASSSSSESESEELLREDSNCNRKRFKRETPEEYSERCRKQREAKRAQRAQETPEEQEARRLKSREANRIRRALETPEQSAARLDQNRIRKKLSRKLGLGFERPRGRKESLEEYQARLEVGQRLFETPEEREIRLALTRELIEVTKKLELDSALPTVSIPGNNNAGEPVEVEIEGQLQESSSTTKNLCKNSNRSEREGENVGGSSQDIIPTEPETFFAMDSENEALQKKQPDETVEEWTERLMGICMPETPSEASEPPQTRKSAIKAKNIMKKIAEKEQKPFGYRSNRGKKRQNETEEQREARREGYRKKARRRKELSQIEAAAGRVKYKSKEGLNKAAERMRLRRSQETPEQRVERLERDKERMRLKRSGLQRPRPKPVKKLQTTSEDVQSSQEIAEELKSISEFKEKRIAKLKAELEHKKMLLENETPEQRTQRLAEKVEKEKQKAIFKSLPKEEQYAISKQVNKEKFQALPITEKVKRIQRVREKSRACVERRKTKLSAEAIAEQKAKNAATARERIGMEKEQYNLYEALVSAQDISKILWEDPFQKCITYWYNYKGKAVAQEIIDWRKHLYKTILDFNPAEYGTLSVELMEHRGIRINENLEIIKQMISTHGTKLHEYFSYKRFYHRNLGRRRYHGLDISDEEERQKKVEEKRAYLRERYRQSVRDPHDREKYNEYCRTRFQNRKLGIKNKRANLGAGIGKKGGPGRKRLPKGFFNGSIYPIASEGSEQQPSSSTSAARNISNDIYNDEAAYLDHGHQDDDYEDNPWEPIEKAFESCGPSPGLNCPTGAGGTSELSCDVCNKKFGHPEALKRHKLYVHQTIKRINKCPHCPQKFSKPSLVKWHIKRVHPNVGNVPTETSVVDENPSINVIDVHTCNVCHTNFSSVDFLSQHFIKMHPKFLDPSNSSTTICDLCNKAFPNLDGLQAHKNKVHRLAGTFLCGYCTKNFQNIEKLETHVAQFHANPEKQDKPGNLSSKKPFQCEICFVSYSKENQLEVHIAQKHPNGPRTFCEFCGKELSPKYVNGHYRKQHPEQKIQKKLNLLSEFIGGMSVPVKKMRVKEMQSFIAAMLKFTTKRDRPGYGKKANIPEWWPTDVPYQSFKMDPRTPEQKEKVSWKNTLKQVIRNCYTFHGKQDLLVEFNEESSSEEDRKKRKSSVRTPKKWLRCYAPDCKERFEEDSGRNSHTRECHPEFSAICEQCGKLMKPESMELHLKITHGKNGRHHLREEVKIEMINSTPLGRMTQAKLKCFIPEMMKWSSGNDNKARWDWNKTNKPDWWPLTTYPYAGVIRDERSPEQKQLKVSFTEALMEIIRACYKHMDKEDLLTNFRSGETGKSKAKSSRSHRTRPSRRKQIKKKKEEPESDEDSDNDSSESEGDEKNNQSGSDSSEEEEQKDVKVKPVARKSTRRTVKRKTQRQASSSDRSGSDSSEQHVVKNIKPKRVPQKSRAKPASFNTKSKQGKVLSTSDMKLQTAGITKIAVVAIERCDNVEIERRSNSDNKKDCKNAKSMGCLAKSRKRNTSSSESGLRRSVRERKATRITQSFEIFESSDDDQEEIGQRRSTRDKKPSKISLSQEFESSEQDDEEEMSNINASLTVEIKHEPEVEVKEEIYMEVDDRNLEFGMEMMEIYPNSNLEDENDCENNPNDEIEIGEDPLAFTAVDSYELAQEAFPCLSIVK